MSYNALNNAVEAARKLLQVRLVQVYPEAKRSMVALLERVTMNHRLSTTAGRALYGYNTIELNPRLLADNLDEVMPTLAHELAHLVDFELNLNYGHGRTWKQVMVGLGFSPDRCHYMDTRAVRRKSKRVDAECDCMVHRITANRAGRIKSGKSVYRCKSCRSLLRVGCE